MTENNRKPNNSQHDLLGTLRSLKANISIQALLAIITVLLTVVLLFSLTVAWYTNIVQTGGLTFTTEQWAFDGTIHVMNGSHAISPGDEGVISLQVNNTGEHLVAASVTVQKDVAVNGMADQQAGLPADTMNKRLYFYVDAPQTRNGELMDRVYVSTNSSYTYTIYPQSSLILNEEMHNAPQLKWEWVYDVLGYYVLGTEDVSGNVNVTEYIRPITYEYDETNVLFDGTPSRWVSSIGGVPVTEFLYRVSSKDGYPGAITPQTVPTPTGYYPISVDANGYGVWAYLCNWYDIENNMRYDTQLSGSSLPYGAIIRLTGQNSRESALPIASEAELRDALDSSDSVSVRLSQNMNLSTPLTLTEGQMLSIDLDGKTLSYLGAEPVISAQAGANVLLSDGTLMGNGENNGVYSSGAQITLYGVDMIAVQEGIEIRDNLNDLGVDTVLHMKDCNVQGAEDGIFIYGNAKGTPTQVVIEDSVIEGKNYSGIFCNGTYYGTDIQILRSTVRGFYVSIYHPQPYSTMTISSSVLEGWTGLAVKGGDVHVIDSTVRGTGAHTPPAYAVSGWTDTGDGIYLEANYTWETNVNISGASNVTSEHAEAVRKYEETATNASIHITGGMYSSDVKQYCAPGYTTIESVAGDQSKIYTVTVAAPQQ